MSESGEIPASAVVLDGEEAHHAVRVKRLVVGDSVELRDGVGGTAVAKIVAISKTTKAGGWSVLLEIAERECVPQPRPLIEVYSAVPKGDHLETMIDMLSQIGVAAWHPLVCDRSVVDPRPGKLERLRRIATESMKQCGRAWTMRIGDEASVSAALAGGLTLVADATGVSVDEPVLREAAMASAVRLLVGPEGGWSEREISVFRDAGVRHVSLAAHVLRIETAAVAGAAILAPALSRKLG